MKVNLKTIDVICPLCHAGFSISETIPGEFQQMRQLQGYEIVTQCANLDCQATLYVQLQDDQPIVDTTQHTFEC